MPLGLDGNVTELTRHPIHAVPDFPIQHDAATDTGTQRDDSHVRNVASRAQPFLSQRSHVGIVLEKNAGSETPLNLRPNGIVRPAGKVR